MRTIVWTIFFLTPFMLGCDSKTVGEKVAPQEEMPRPGTIRLVSITPLVRRPAPVEHISVLNYDVVSTIENVPNFTFLPEARHTPLVDSVGVSCNDPGEPVAFLEHLNMPAAKILAVEVTLSARGINDDFSFKAARLYFARDKDVLSSENPMSTGLPFTVKRSVRFLPKGSDTPNTWIAQVNGHELWSGTIDRLYVSVGFVAGQLADGTDYPNVFIHQIQFIGERYGEPIN